MAVIKRAFAAAAVLHNTRDYGGSDAVLAADGAYDLTSDVDLESTGYAGSHVLIEFAGNNSQDDFIVDVFGSLDGATYDTEPHPLFCRIVKNRGTRQAISIIVTDLLHFRIGVKSFATNTSFQYRITHQAWNLSNA